MINMTGWAGKAILAVFCLFLLLLGLSIPLDTSKVIAAPLCYGYECDGLNPQSLGCGADAQTGAGRLLGTIGRAEGRYSEACNAKWERTRLTSGSNKFAAGSLRYGGSNYNYSRNVTSPEKIYAGQQVYTPMQGGVDLFTRNCGRLEDTGPISVPITLSNTYCSNVD